MKIDILFALPGPRHSIQGDKLLVVAAATEHEDPNYLKGSSPTLPRRRWKPALIGRCTRSRWNWTTLSCLACRRAKPSQPRDDAPGQVHGSMLN